MLVHTTMAAVEPAPTFYDRLRSAFSALTHGYFPVAASGLENIPASGPAVLAGNHPSLLDGVLLLVLSPRPVRFLVSSDFYNHPLLAGICRAIGCIPVFKKREHNGDALHAAVEALERGEVIGIFPEGTTLEHGEMQTVRRGVGLLALRTGAPIVPFGIAGAKESLPLFALAPKPTPLAFSFGPPLRVERQDLQPALDKVREAILQAMQKARQAYEGIADRRHAVLKVLLAGLVVVPLTAVLQKTSNWAAAKN